MKDRKKIEQPVAEEFKRFNDEFADSLRSETHRLQAAIDQILHASGKHVRPLLVLLTAKACGKVTDHTINSAVFLELLHTATLIHDDVIDETKERRGVPSLNAVFDNRISVLVGDYVLSTALIRSIQTGNLQIINIVSNLGRDLSEGEIKQLETAEEAILDEACYMQVIKKRRLRCFLPVRRSGLYRQMLRRNWCVNAVSSVNTWGIVSRSRMISSTILKK
ncbi:polyprenyl synthetase family protein [Parabacteroides faecis]|nr:polyprenyl synthetase family protein [Parabacteroides faecis]